MTRFLIQNLMIKNVYDMVVATEVIEHLHDPLKQFRWIDQHIKKQGYFFLHDIALSSR